MGHANRCRLIMKACSPNIQYSFSKVVGWFLIGFVVIFCFSFFLFGLRFFACTLFSHAEMMLLCHFSHYMF